MSLEKIINYKPTAIDVAHLRAIRLVGRDIHMRHGKIMDEEQWKALQAIAAKVDTKKILADLGNEK